MTKGRDMQLDIQRQYWLMLGGREIDEHEYLNQKTLILYLLA